jgi:hypothetical protein
MSCKNGKLDLEEKGNTSDFMPKINEARDADLKEGKE